MFPIRVYNPGPTFKLNLSATILKNIQYLFDQQAQELAKIAINTKSALQKYPEFASLISIVRRHPINTALEIGTYKGGTLYVICQTSNPQANIISLDFGTRLDITFNKQETQKFQSYTKPGQTLTCIKRDSHSPATKNYLKKILKNKKLDLLFIDGDHKYQGAMADYEMYSSFVKKGGIILFHDILFHPLAPSTQVDQVWKELCFHYRHIEFVDHSDTRGGWGQWGGIGLIYFDPKIDFKNRNIN